MRILFNQYAFCGYIIYDGVIPYKKLATFFNTSKGPSLQIPQKKNKNKKKTNNENFVIMTISPV